jgi:glycine cleavage system transcriptional repressor
MLSNKNKIKNQYKKFEALINYSRKHKVLCVIPIYNYLIVSAIGNHRLETLSDLARVCFQCGCNILNSKINALGQDMAIMLFLGGNWGAIAKMEATLPSVAQRLGLAIQTRRTHEASRTEQIMSYNVQIVAIDRPGILSGISDFFKKFAIQIEEVSTSTYISTGTRMVSLHFKINIADKVHLATLREQFMNYCDNNNLDSFMEPFKSPS